MEIDSSLYGPLILYSTAVGAALGAVYDVFRIRRIASASSDSFRYIPEKFHPKKKPSDKAAASPSERDAESECANTSDGAKNSFGKRLCAVIKHKLHIAGNVLVFFEDILFWLIAALTVTIMLYAANGGRIRAFAPVCCALGFAIWYYTAGKLVIAFSENIIYALRTALSAAAKLIYTVFIRPPAALIGFTASAIIKAVRRRRRARFTRLDEKRLLAAAKRGFSLCDTAPKRAPDVQNAEGSGGNEKKHKKNKHIRKSGRHNLRLFLPNIDSTASDKLQRNGVAEGRGK